jgi:hypothetical protein
MKYKFIVDFKDKEEILMGEVDAENLEGAKKKVMDELDKGITIIDKEDELDSVRRRLTDILEEISIGEFVDFAFSWLGEERIWEMIKDSINDYPEVEELEEEIKKLEEGGYKDRKRNGK